MERDQLHCTASAIVTLRLKFTVIDESADAGFDRIEFRSLTCATETTVMILATFCHRSLASERSGHPRFHSFHRLWLAFIPLAPGIGCDATQLVRDLRFAATGRLLYFRGLRVCGGGKAEIADKLRRIAADARRKRDGNASQSL